MQFWKKIYFKAVLIIPFIGNILSFILYIANYYWFDISPYYLLWGSVAGVTGNEIKLYKTAFLSFKLQKTLHSRFWHPKFLQV